MFGRKKTSPEISASIPALKKYYQLVFFAAFYEKVKIFLARYPLQADRLSESTGWVQLHLIQ